VSNSELTQVLRHVSTAATVAAPVIPGVGGIVLGVVSRALALAADFAAAGRDPIKEIQRVRDLDPLLTQVEQGWQDELNRRFPKPKTVEGKVDPYED
jgi:hypothetical protein